MSCCSFMTHEAMNIIQQSFYPKEDTQLLWKCLYLTEPLLEAHCLFVITLYPCTQFCPIRCWPVCFSNQMCKWLHIGRSGSLHPNITVRNKNTTTLKMWYTFVHIRKRLQILIAFLHYYYESITSCLKLSIVTNFFPLFLGCDVSRSPWRQMSAEYSSWQSGGLFLRGRNFRVMFNQQLLTEMVPSSRERRTWAHDYQGRWEMKPGYSNGTSTPISRTVHLLLGSVRTSLKCEEPFW